MLRLRTFGGLAVDHAAFEDGGPARRRPLALLALLAVAGERGVSRDKLAAYLWPESRNEHARNSLSQALTTLRRDLGADDLVVGSIELRLNGSLIQCDVQEFIRALSGGDPASAVALYGGPFLDGVFLRAAPEFERWTETERRRLHLLNADALEQLAQRTTASGDHVAAARWWRRRTEAEPLESRAALGLMRSLVAASDASSALRHFSAYESLLRTELGIEPDQDLRELATRLRRMTREVDGAGAAEAPEAVRTIASPMAIPRRRASRAAAIAVAMVLAVGSAAAALAIARRDRPLIVGGVLQVTRSPDTLNFDASISPDGKFVAYAAGAPGGMRILVRALNGSRPIVVSDGVTGNHRWPRWSPDGLAIAFQMASPRIIDGRPTLLGGSIYRVPAFGGAPQLLARPGAWPAWSPDGTRLAYVASSAIWVMPAVGGSASRIDTAANPFTPAWSPDGRRIAYVRDNSSFLGSGYGEIGHMSLWVVGVDGRGKHRLDTEQHLLASPVWMPDGQSLLFVSDREGVRDLYRQRIGRDSLLGSPERVTTGANVFTFTISRDGSRLAYSSLAFPEGTNIWMAPIGEDLTPFSSAHAVTNEKQQIDGFAVSHDHRWLVYDSDRAADGHSHLFKVAFDGSTAVREPIQLTTGGANEFDPRWSPDDKAIAFHRNTGSRREVFVIDADGRFEQRITADSQQGHLPDWSPDGRRIAFAALAGRPNGQDVAVAERDARGAWSRPIAINDPREPGAGPVVRWSPAGDMIAFATNAGIRMLPSAGGPIRDVLTSRQLGQRVTSVSWASDPRVIYFQARDSNRVISLWKLALPHGKPRRLFTLSDGTRQTRSVCFDVDGKYLYFTSARGQADVFVASLRRER